jgi:hypothetical protein
VSLIDSSAFNVTTVISAPLQNQTDIHPFVIDNLLCNRVINIITDETGTVVLVGKPSGSMSVSSYARGVVYNNESIPMFTEGQAFPEIRKPRKMLRKGKWFTKGKPVYSGLTSSHVINVKDHGAKGDGSTDDLAVLQKILIHNAGTGKIGPFLFIQYCMRRS